MSKKRPRKEPRHQSESKWEPSYWRARLFRNSYTCNGRRFETKGWCVKIQRDGRRRTISLHASDSMQAATEACKYYRTIVNEGWEAATAGDHSKPGVALRGDLGRLDPNYWAQGLIHREYTSQSLPPRAHRELSIRIDHEGASCYFPLGNVRREEAAQRALQIYKVIISKGWEAALKQVSRELTVAFHWSDNPLAWTYTTIRTENRIHTTGTKLKDSSALVVRVAIAESDAGIRVALANCVNRMPGFECAAAFANSKDALDHAMHHALHLVLIGQNAAEKPGSVCLEELRSVAPAVAGLIYSVHEDSEELFRTTPGGAGYYLLKRVGPGDFLEPIVEVLEARSPGKIIDAAWQYFKNTVFSSPIGGSTQELTNLTQREHEVLALLSKGQQDKAIADKLRISIYTVHVHVRNIFEKLRVHNRTGAVVKYFQK